MLYSKALLLIGLVIMLLISAIAVIVNKDHSRSLFMQTQKQKFKLDNYEVEWGKLQLELTTLSAESRVEQKAIEQLNLKRPSREQIVYLKPLL